MNEVRKITSDEIRRKLNFLKNVKEGIEVYNGNLQLTSFIQTEDEGSNTSLTILKRLGYVIKTSSTFNKGWEFTVETLEPSHARIFIKTFREYTNASLARSRAKAAEQRLQINKDNYKKVINGGRFEDIEREENQKDRIEPKGILSHATPNLKEGINKVTTNNLSAVLRMCEIHVSLDTLDKIIDLVELIEEKGDDISMKNIFELQEIWKEHNK